MTDQAPKAQPAPATAPAGGPVSAPKPGDPKPQISFEEFAKLDLRVAKVIKAEHHPDADRLFVLQLDDGSGSLRQVCAGIRGYYTAEDLVGRSVVIVANLAPRKIRGQESRGMVLAASDVPKDAAPGVERKVVLLALASEVPPGSIVS
jgi:methionine--tRNA ligase beta chain